jgi:hypothetical protein
MRSRKAAPPDELLSVAVRGAAKMGRFEGATRGIPAAKGNPCLRGTRKAEFKPNQGENLPH